MSSIKNPLFPTLALTLVSSAVLVACGGGGGSSEPAPPAAPTTATITGKAVDGPLQGATACYDLNDNGVCDASEPTSGPTDANGAFSFEVPVAEAGKHRVVVNVPATAIDKDTGVAVGTAYTLTSPASGASGAQSVFASPLSTLVQAHMDNTGATATVASDFIKAQAGLSVSPLADFTATASAGNTQASTVARLATLTAITQASNLATVVGQVDVSGAKVTQADINKAVVNSVLNALPNVAALSNDPAITGASGTALQSALKAAASTAAANLDITAASALAAVGLAKLAPDASANGTPAVGASLVALRYTDANNWYWRANQSTVADNTPDANGLVHFYTEYKQAIAGVIDDWGNNISVARNGDTHWTGSTWTDCPLGVRSSQTVRDAKGRAVYDFCASVEKGVSVRTPVSVAGKTIASVVSDSIRTFPGGASGVDYANWGPADLAVLGSATFPTGAALQYQTNTITDTAITYDVRTSNQAGAYPAGVVAGGDARTNTSLACNINAATSATLYAAVSTLEELIAGNAGTPCMFAPGGTAPNVSGATNEWWSNSTVGMGTLAGAATPPSGTGAYYSGNALLRVAFSANGQLTRYYSCLQRASDGSTRNCTQIGTGTYSMQTLGDARVLTLGNLPELAKRLGYDRNFVQRGGKVYFGFKNPAGVTTHSLRLNLEATNAVFSALSLPVLAPK